MAYNSCGYICVTTRDDDGQTRDFIIFYLVESNILLSNKNYNLSTTTLVKSKKQWVRTNVPGVGKYDDIKICYLKFMFTIKLHYD